MKFGLTMHISPPNLMGTKNLKIWKSKMTDGGYLKNRKIVMSPKPFGRFWRNFAWWHMIVDGRYFDKLKMLGYISAAVRPILMKFGMTLQIRPSNLKGDQKFENLKIQDGRRRPSIALSQKPFSLFWRNFVDGRYLEKSKKYSYQIWHCDASWTSEPDQSYLFCYSFILSK